MSWSMEAAGVTAAARLRCPNGSESFYRSNRYAVPVSTITQLPPAVEVESWCTLQVTANGSYGTRAFAKGG